MAKSTVYFTKEITPEAVLKMYRQLGEELPGKVADKVHSGEAGNQNFLRPEFLSRIDEIVVFRPLNEEDFKKIAVLMLNEYVGTLNERGITLRWTDEAVANIAHRAVGGKRGARDIRNTIRRTVEDKIASLIVEKGEGNVTGILVTEKDGEIDVESI